MLQGSGLLTCVRILVVLPADCNERLRESEAPEDFSFTVVLSEDAVVFTRISFDKWALICRHSLLVRIDELLPCVNSDKLWILEKQNSCSN